MNSRLIRVLLVVLAIAIGMAASYFLKTIDADMTTHRVESEALRDQARALLVTVSDVRAAQVSYVAQGQGDFWMGRVSKLLPALDQQLADFKAALTSMTAQTDLEPALAASENFHKLDARVRDYVQSTDLLLASDLIFSDGLEATGTAAAQIDAALKSELQVREASLATLRMRALTILGGGAGGILLILMLLGFIPARASEPVSLPSVDGIDGLTGVEPVSPFAPNLKGAAELCTELARVFEARQLPGLLERTATVLNASGLIVWLADPSGQELRPAMSFGYSDPVVARMGGIPRQATNAAAAAFRSAELRTVNGDGFTNGALVAPLITSEGCIGVLSAEMKGGSEHDESSQALVSIFAAQLATLVTPPHTAALDQAASGG